MNAPRSHPPEPESPAPDASNAPDAADATEAEAPDWMDVSPDAPPAPDAAQHEARDEEKSRARWASRWNGFVWLLALATAIGVTRWVTWRQSVMYEPPIEVSVVATPAPSTPEERATASATATPVPQRLLVHVIGLVKKPGVFEVPAGARLKDALHQAGGVLPNADLEAINLAEPLEDGRQYRVSARQSNSDTATAEPQRERQVLAAPVPSPRAPSRDSQPRAASTKAAPSQIDLNRATLIELQELPGVGPATAQHILEHRAEIGGFKSVDDLDGVKGIGPKKLEKIRPHAVVR